MKQTIIKEIKEGDFFKFSENGKVYVRGHYDRGSKTYAYYPFEDVNDEHFARGTRKIFIDFIF